MYSLIIGISPSKGARSPKLWNKAYNEYKIDCEMRACDIANEKQLIDLMNELKTDKKFQGGSVTFPYKEKVAQILHNSLRDEATSRLGTINSLYRNDRGDLCAANTDGIAALRCIQNKFFSEKIKPQKILVLGVGGVGKAVIAFISDMLLRFYPNIELFASSRKKDIAFFSVFNKVHFVEWNDRYDYLSNRTLVINCTCLGDYQNLNESPISLDLMNEKSTLFGVYDVIHTPSLSKLLLWAKSKNIVYSNGVDMNLMQAAIAFKYATNSKFSVNEITYVMSN